MYDDESFLGHLKETNSLHSISKKPNQTPSVSIMLVYQLYRLKSTTIFKSLCQLWYCDYDDHNPLTMWLCCT